MSAPSSHPPKPLLDAINDALTALTDVVRSVRANAEAKRRRAHEGASKAPKRLPKPKKRTRAIVVQATVKRDTQAVTAQVRGRRHGLKAKIVHAWDLLTRDPTAEARSNGHSRRM